MSSARECLLHSVLVLVCSSLDCGSDPGPQRTAALAALRAVHATSKVGRDAASAALARLSSLTPRSLRALALPQLFPSVSKLTLTRARDLLDAPARATLVPGSWAAVTTLDLSYAFPEAEAGSVETLRLVLSAAPNVTSLCLSGCSFPPDADVDAALGAIAPRLLHLDLAMASIPSVLLVLQRCFAVETLNLEQLTSDSSSDELGAAVGALAARGHLRDLSFSDAPLGTATLGGCLAAGHASSGALARVTCGKRAGEILAPLLPQGVVDDRGARWSERHWNRPAADEGAAWYNWSRRAVWRQEHRVPWRAMAFYCAQLAGEMTEEMGSGRIKGVAFFAYTRGVALVVVDPPDFSDDDENDGAQLVKVELASHARGVWQPASPIGWVENCDYRSDNIDGAVEVIAGELRASCTGVHRGGCGDWTTLRAYRLEAPRALMAVLAAPTAAAQRGAAAACHGAVACAVNAALLDVAPGRITKPGNWR